MITYDTEAFASENLTPSERRHKCRYEIASLLAHHWPTPLKVDEIEHLFRRFFKSANKYIHRDRLNTFLEEMESDGYIECRYQRERVISVVLRKNSVTKEFLNLTPCMQPLRRCSMASCAQSLRCEAYLAALPDGEKSTRRTGT